MKKFNVLQFFQRWPVVVVAGDEGQHGCEQGQRWLGVFDCSEWGGK
jgi:hypothetical protein